MSGLLLPLTTGGVGLISASSAGWALAVGLAAAGDLESGSKAETIFPRPITRESLALQSSNHCFNKPYGVLPCFTDPEGRPTLADYVAIPGIYAAARLDLDSEGLILLTSDGTLPHRITEPQHKLSKVYLAQVERLPNEEALEQLRKGVVLNGKKTRPAEVRLLPDHPQLPNRPMPIRFRQKRPDCLAENHAPRGVEPTGPAHDCCSRASDAATCAGCDRADCAGRPPARPMAGRDES